MRSALKRLLLLFLLASVLGCGFLAGKTEIRVLNQTDCDLSGLVCECGGQRLESESLAQGESTVFTLEDEPDFPVTLSCLMGSTPYVIEFDLYLVAVQGTDKIDVVLTGGETEGLSVRCNELTEGAGLVEHPVTVSQQDPFDPGM